MRVRTLPMALAVRSASERVMSSAKSEESSCHSVAEPERVPRRLASSRTIRSAFP